MFGLKAASIVSIPVFTSLRRLNSLFMLIAESIILDKSPTLNVGSSILVMVFGAIIAGQADLNASWYTYLIVLTNNLFTTLYFVYLKKVQQTTEISELSLLYYTSLLSIPSLVFMAYFSGEFSLAFYNNVWHFNNNLINNSYGLPEYIVFRLLFLASGFLAFGVNWSSNWCTAANSPLTTSVIGQVKNILVTFIGFTFFDDLVPEGGLLFGLIIGVIGGILYSYSKYLEEYSKKLKTV